MQFSSLKKGFICTFINESNMGQALNEAEARRHAKLALEMFNEGLGLLVRAISFRPVRSCIRPWRRPLRHWQSQGLDEAREALSRGRWTVSLLDKAARRLGDTTWRAWDAAYFLHVNGFHEVRIDIDEVRARVPIIQSLIDEVKRRFSIDVNLDLGLGGLG